MKELDQIFLQEGVFASIKGYLCLTKGHNWTIQKDRWRLNSTKSEVIFDKFYIYIKKEFFFKKSTFNEASNPRMLYLSKIGPDIWAIW